MMALHMCECLPVLVNCLGCLGVVEEAFHGVGDKGVSEHVRDLIKVLRPDVGAAAQVVVSQLRGLA